jgi:hypothetical protein
MINLSGFENNWEDRRLILDYRHDELLRGLAREVSVDPVKPKTKKLMRRQKDDFTPRLTLFDITKHTPTGDSPGVPAGFSMCEDENATLNLMEAHLAALNRALDGEEAKTLMGTNLGDYPMSELGLQHRFDSVEEFADAIRPVVEGFRWRRGHVVFMGDDDAAIIYTPPMDLSREGGSPFPILYTCGNPTPEQLDDITFDYALFLAES